MGLTVLYPPADAKSTLVLQVDIVAIHGLNGDPIKTWTEPKTKAFWLQDFLPQDVAGARVLSFGYNADVAFGNTTADVVDHAKDLLGCLLDKREGDDELRRPIIFIAHSLGGILVKQALFQARIENQYNSINEHTAGIIFMGTPHRGSEKASYGKILAKVATTLMKKPTSRLVSALQRNSEALMRLTSDFKFQLSNYQVVSFYEMKPMKIFSSLIVEKEPALLEVTGEDQIPVDANHQDMCKFGTCGNSTYERLWKRIHRIIEAKDVGQSYASLNVPKLRNKYYEVPYTVSSIFTGREEVGRQLSESFFPAKTQGIPSKQTRFVLYGLGGSGKTQVSLKTAQDHRENYWGIFWIDASTNGTAEQGFLNIAKTCGLKEDLQVVKRWLSNAEDPWLLIIDNADDPSQDVSKYFPAGNRGAVIITTRNPDCRVHATIGSSEFNRMEDEEAITLLIRAADVNNTSDEASRKLAKPVVELLGHLALAIIQAGAVIRRKLYSMEEYCSSYACQRKQLLSNQSIQASDDYRYTVYTTWEISVDKIKNTSSKTSENALEILYFFAFLHFDKISENIFKEAWKNRYQRTEWIRSNRLGVLRKDTSEDWNPQPIREAIILLSSFSLISIDSLSNRISIHPLVHAWARDRLFEVEQERCWNIAASTLTLSITRAFQIFDYNYRRYLLPHVHSCLNSIGSKSWTSGTIDLRYLEMNRYFSHVYLENGYYKEALELNEKSTEAHKQMLGEEHPDTLRSTGDLVISYMKLGRYREALGLNKKVVEASKQILGEEHPDTVNSMKHLAATYYYLGRYQEALRLDEKVLEVQQRILGEEHLDTLNSMENLATSYDSPGRYQEALGLDEKVVEARIRILGEEHLDTISSMKNLATSYHCLGRYQEALELDEKVVEAYKRILGEEHPDTLRSIIGLACGYERLNRDQEALELNEKVTEALKRTLGKEHPDTRDSMENLVFIYEKLSRYLEATELMEKVVEVSKRMLGEEHPDTLEAINILEFIRENYRKHSLKSTRLPDRKS